MNNYDWITPRHRHRQLVIVEGNHEKNELLKLMIKCFPEIELEFNDIIIYKTNIYQIYDDVIKFYPDGWNEPEIDLPLVVSRKIKCETLNKINFNNILLIFDYERHDPNFSEEKIITMQQYFSDVTDAGQLYLNYPMVESYQHMFQIPDSGYIDRKISVSLQPGSQYKNLIKDTMIAKMVNLPIKIKEILAERFCLNDSGKCDSCVEQLLNINDSKDLKEQIENILFGVLESRDLITAKFQIANILTNCGYIDYGITYFMYMRKLFIHIIFHNILKANRIQSEVCMISDVPVNEYFHKLEQSVILDKQNEASRDEENGFIWILNTSVFLIPEYNLNLIEIELSNEG